MKLKRLSLVWMKHSSQGIGAPSNMLTRLKDRSLELQSIRAVRPYHWTLDVTDVGKAISILLVLIFFFLQLPYVVCSRLCCLCALFVMNRQNLSFLSCGWLSFRKFSSYFQSQKVESMNLWKIFKKLETFNIDRICIGPRCIDTHIDRLNYRLNSNLSAASCLYILCYCCYSLCARDCGRVKNVRVNKSQKIYSRVYFHIFLWGGGWKKSDI